MDSQTKVFRAHRALAWLYAVMGFGVTASVVFAHQGNVDAAIFIFPIFFLSLFVAHYLTARACKAGKPGGRKASIVIACLMLLGVPMGTIVGIYLLVNTWKPWAPKPIEA